MVFGLFKSKDKAPKPHYKVWMTQQAKCKGVLSDVKVRLGVDQAVVVVAHFEDTYRVLADLLNPLPVDCLPLAKTPAWRHIKPGPDGRVALYLLHSDLLAKKDLSADPVPGELPASFIITEVHGSAYLSEQLEWLIGAIPFRAHIERHVSLDEPTMSLFANNTTVQMLEKLGMKDDDCIDHPMIDSSIDRALQRYARNAVSERPAKSAREWISLNCPDLDKNSD